MIAFIDDHRGAYGVEPICRVLKIAPSSYHTHAARRRRPDTAPPRVQRDAALRVEIRRVFDENFQVYGVRKVWRQLVREGEDVARCTVALLMSRMGLQGVIRVLSHSRVSPLGRRQCKRSAQTTLVLKTSSSMHANPIRFGIASSRTRRFTRRRENKPLIFINVLAASDY